MTEFKWIVSSRQRCDLEMLLINAFKPLSGFLSHADYQAVLYNKRLSNNQLWPIPVTLDVTENFANKIITGDKVLLCDSDNSALARLTVTDKWEPDKLSEAYYVFGTHDIKHPGVNYLMNEAGSWYLGGPVELIKIPIHYDFSQLRFTPESLQKYFSEKKFKRIVAFQTRNPIHRAHMELMLRASKEIDAHILINPVVGLTKPGDIDHYTRVRCYQHIMGYFAPGQATLSLLPLAMRMGGPGEALWHAIIRKNFGCTHFIVGRDHAGPGNDSSGKPFYDPYAAQDTVKEHQKEIGIEMVPFQEMVFVKERNQYCTANEVKPEETALRISGTKLRNALLTDQPLPDWFTYPEIMDELRQSNPAKHKQGFTLFFTGLSGSGKTTLTQALMARLMSRESRRISLLDGDVVRQVLTSELGFSKEHRDLNIKRIGFVASEITKAGGIVLCAAIAPYQQTRNENRKLISQYGSYIEIYLSTSLSVCEARDVKGLYVKARKGDLKGFTGIDDPYEAPTDAEIIIDTAKLSIEESVDKIIAYLQEADYLKKTDNIHPISNYSLSRVGAG